MKQVPVAHEQELKSFVMGKTDEYDRYPYKKIHNKSATGEPAELLPDRSPSGEITMMRFIAGLLTALSFAILGVAPAAASLVVPGTYRLFDHGYGNQGAFYGLRLDSEDKFFSFSTGDADAKLIWNGGDSATISGFIAENADPTSAATGGSLSLWSIDYTLSGITTTTNVFDASYGSGQLCYLGTCIALTGKQDSSGVAFAFRGDGHRLPGDNSTVVGRGWLMAAGTNDFLVSATLVPLPAALPLFASGVAFLSLIGWRRKGVGDK